MMMNFRTYLFLFLAITLAAGCKRKKAAEPVDKPMDVNDFIAFFQPASLPYQFTDIMLKKKETDTSVISYPVFRQFVSDSLITAVFGAKANPKIYPLGKMEVPGDGNFLFTKVVYNDKKAVYILWFNKEQEYTAGIPVLRTDQQTTTTAQSVVMDKKYTITRTLIRKNKDGSSSEGKDVYGLNTEATAFMLIMTDALDDRMTEMVNPIDTMQRKHKFSGDYILGKMNLVSVRDGRKPDRVSFFVHFEKDNGECTGELKGEALIRSSSMAEYREPGDPCVLSFHFLSSSVTLKEEEGCGVHRGMRCLFNGVYTKKKVVQPKTPKKAAKK